MFWRFVSGYCNDRYQVRGELVRKESVGEAWRPVRWSHLGVRMRFVCEPRRAIFVLYAVGFVLVRAEQICTRRTNVYAEYKAMRGFAPPVPHQFLAIPLML